MKSIGINSNYIKSLLTRISQSSATPSVIADAVAAYLVAHPPTVSSLPATSITTDSTHRFTSDANLTKLAGIEVGAEVNVQPDWNALSGDGAIANKPTLLTLPTVKADTDIASAITLKHSNSADHSHTNKTDLDNYTPDSFEPFDAAIQLHIASAHAPSNAQKNSDITKAEIEAKLTGEISSHSHAGGSGLTLAQTLAKTYISC